MSAALTKPVQFNVQHHGSHHADHASSIGPAGRCLIMLPKRTLAEELAELATPQPAPGEFPAVGSACLAHLVAPHLYERYDSVCALQRPILKRTS